MTLSRAEERNRIRFERRRRWKRFVAASGLTIGIGSAVVWLWHWTGG
ncbi:hypothetical protein [Paenibacillus alkalitolerans]|nr:hypothetical protein [Paenibacillus alkalitolerans]